MPFIPFRNITCQQDDAVRFLRQRQIWGGKFSARNLKRFKFLIRCLRFEDSTTSERKPVDNIAPIRKLFDGFIRNCKNSYSLEQRVTIDEKLESLRGGCKFKQYITSKPARYRDNIYALCDVIVCLTWNNNNFKIYSGKQPEGPYNLSNKPPDVVKRLV